MKHLSDDPTERLKAGGGRSMARHPGAVAALLLATLSLALGCGGKARPARIGVANAAVGECVDPASAGVLSDQPRLRRADRDLNGDARKEQVMADKNICQRGNCSWNLFARQDGCERYIGTIAASTIEVLGSSSDAGFSDLRGWWKLRGGKRQLVQNYRFRDGGYQLTDVLLCRQDGDDRLLCADEEQESD